LLVALGASGNFIDEPRMIPEGHVLNKSGSVPDMRAGGDIKPVCECFQGLIFECKTMPETAKGEPLPIFVKAIGSG
jgi:hypothetical protein